LFAVIASQPDADGSPALLPKSLSELREFAKTAKFACKLRISSGNWPATFSFPQNVNDSLIRERYIL
jgi:hypothetical protein